MWSSILLICVLLVSIVYPAIEDHPSHDEFVAWKLQHSKNYSSVGEHNARFGHYLAARSKIEHLNRNSSSATHGLTNLADLSTVEFKQLLGHNSRRKCKSAAAQSGSISNIENVINDVEHIVGDALDIEKNIQAVVDVVFGATPNSKLHSSPVSHGGVPSPVFDWCLVKSQCTPIKDQIQCGSCWAFATTEVVESVWSIAGHNLTVLAPQQLVDCDTVDSGCNGGDAASALQYVIGAGGIDTEADYPYTGEDGICSLSGSEYGKITKYFNAYGTSESTMAANLAKYGPLTIAVDADSWQYYTSGILTATDCGNDVDHAVVAVGYQLGNYWNVRNSWGTGWGENGYIRLAFGTNTCSLTEEVLAAAV
jgi:C1A family cysteine protease